ncbi:MAG: branched-chain amino acid ABC transporter permease [Hamadaea sp.]|uniref:branched-chain amino acid ABC transporter permease n=1 Tax=Hamadaea sp. TaxID=2024425 RepID=UPI0018554C22|nr:branched-chain amino acid ABC transporter permease [Hamadaea sp.]NUR74366.1 branched-chain amino acid ABC transporter permease [Hamadaea sp.]NUT21551.1 branched-chain amino acid ABC transporter permease [Hamadaea sp.]
MSQPTIAVPTPKRPQGVDRTQLRWPLGFTVAAVVVVVFYGFILPFLVPGVRGWVQDWLPISEINVALIWAMSALGLNIVVGYAGLLDLGYVAFWALGGYTTAWLMSDFGFGGKVNFNIFGSPGAASTTGIHLNLVLVFLAAAGVCALFGVIIGAPTLRLRSDYLALVTLGFGEIIPQIFRNGDEDGLGFNLTNATLGIGPIDSMTFVRINRGDVVVGKLNVFDHVGRFILFSLLTALIIFVSLRLRQGRLGRAWLAIREDELAASAMGVPLMRAKLAAYAVGAIAGGIGGVAYALHLGRMLPDPFTFAVSITLLAMVVLGGMGNVWGVLLGALMISWFNSTGLPQIGDSFNSAFGTNVNFPSFNFLIFGGVLVLMMLFRREGLLPESRTRLVLHEGEAGDTQAEEPEQELVDETTVKSGDVK